MSELTLLTGLSDSKDPHPYKDTNIGDLRTGITMSYAQPHTRFSLISNSSVSSADHLPSSNASTSTTRFSLPTAPSINTTLGSQSKAPPRTTIYDRNLNKTRTAEVSASAFTFLFSEMIQYTQKRVSGIEDLERRLVLYHLSHQFHQLLFFYTA